MRWARLQKFQKNHPQTLQRKMGIIKNKNQDKIANIFSHFAKMAIRNIKNCQIFKIYRIAKFSAQLLTLWARNFIINGLGQKIQLSV